MSKKVLASSLIAGALLCSAATAIYAEPESERATPDFTGVWARAPESEFLAVPGDKEGEPLVKLPVEGPDAGEIIAGDFANPILQPWAREIVKKNAESEMRLQHVNQADDTCWPVAMPQILNLREPAQFVQTKDKIVILYQRDHQIRTVWLNRNHPANVTPSWYGDSVGHFEGDTLVVDTIGIKTHKMSLVDTYGTPHTDRLHLVERYRLIKDDKGKGLEFILRVEDAGAFTMPWKALGYYRPNRQPEILEVVCAENNRGFDNEPIGLMPEEKTPSF